MRRAPLLLLSLSLAACGAATPAPTSVPTTPTAITPVMQEQPMATLAIDPSTVNIQVGKTVEVKVLLDLKQYTSKTYEAVVVYDPKLLEVIDADAKMKDTQITLGMYADAALNRVEEPGRIRVAGYSKDVAVRGTGTLMTITFKALAEGKGTITFDRVNGLSTTKTKVILTDKPTDILLSANGAALEVSK